MINSNWTNFCHHIKQDPTKARKKDARYNGEDMMDMTFIGPDADMISITKKGKVIHLSIIWKLLIVSTSDFFLVNINIFLINRARNLRDI